MKIIFTGGGTGGHFYPIISIAQAINKISKEKKLIKPTLYFFSNTPYNHGLLYDNNIEYKKTSAGKLRRYFSIFNFLDLFKTAWGVINALIDVYDIYPDVVFGKGGFSSFPTLFAARVLRIPVIIHESDSVPGRVNKWAGKFAYRIALSYPEAASYFKAERIAVTGQPIQRELAIPAGGAHRYWNIDEGVPTLLILGGSTGAEKINNVILDALPELLENYQVIHQTGEKNIKMIEETSNSILFNNPHKLRYKPKGYLTLLDQRMAAGAADLVISRAGSTIFEIAAWGKPAIIIPISDSNGGHQIKNAFAYAKNGAAEVIKEENLTEHVFVAEINRIIQSPEIKRKMSDAAKSFFKPDADQVIAKEILSIALGHEELE
jgi:UDP-N-acetylglucosamine--N-acetylmuramyl-(pentapeptide) pyrophosphoryl-undecaprenol N-acetylglucosamine transferase